MVDSTPTEQGPPSRIASILPSISSSICWAVVGLGFPEVFPEGAAMGTSASRISRRAIGWLGQRIPTVSNPPVVRFGTLERRDSTMVSGPGQKRSASKYADWGIFRQYRSSQTGSAICRISGLSCGRPFASKIRATAAGSRPLAPRPYTVSVGIPTSPPARMICAASWTSASCRSLVVFMSESASPTPPLSPPDGPPQRPAAPAGCGTPTIPRS